VKKSIANPEAYFDQTGALRSMPGSNTQAAIMQAGSPAKINWLRTLQSLHNAAAKDAPGYQKQVEYFKKVKAPEEVPTATAGEMMKALQQYYARKAPGVRFEEKPAFVNYDFVKAAFWDLYCKVVYRETGLTRPVMDGNRKETLAALVHWFNGDTPEYNEDGTPKPGRAIFDPQKSIYLYGPRGLGKTSIVEALSMLGNFLAVKGWKARAFDFLSMEELYFGGLAGSRDIDVLRFLEGNFIFDELSERHLEMKHYGTDVNFAANVLIARHNAWKRKRVLTIITTNLTPQALAAELKDSRLMDRLYQQYEFWQVTGKNLR
jgi:hypothetical protein